MFDLIIYYGGWFTTMYNYTVPHNRQVIRNTLDPLLEKLSKDYIDDADLSSRIQNLFKVTGSCGGDCQLLFLARRHWLRRVFSRQARPCADPSLAPFAM